MTRDAAFINEVWSALKPYIAAKERLHAADQLVEIFDEYGFTDGFEHETDFEREIKTAIVSFYGEAEEEEEIDEI